MKNTHWNSSDNVKSLARMDSWPEYRVVIEKFWCLIFFWRAKTHVAFGLFENAANQGCEGATHGFMLLQDHGTREEVFIQNQGGSDPDMKFFISVWASSSPGCVLGLLKFTFVAFLPRTPKSAPTKNPYLYVMVCKLGVVRIAPSVNPFPARIMTMMTNSSPANR